MENRELNIKDIAGYLPYGLKYKMPYGLVTESEPMPFVITDYIDDVCYNIRRQYKPILRPVSDIYRTITHDGEEITPIVELAKLVTDCEWSLAVEVGDDDDDDKFIYAKYDVENWKFFFSEYERAFRFLNHCDCDRWVTNQYYLFDYLHELKIDYRGLIDAGLAIDCNTLEINPYK